MKEITDILSAYRDCSGTGALATVVRVMGSAYRKPGARMLILNDGITIGGVSGGCIERDVVYRAGAVIATGIPVVVRYDTTPDEDGRPTYSLGCGGAVDVLIEFLPAPESPHQPRKPVLRYSEEPDSPTHDPALPNPSEPAPSAIKPIGARCLRMLDTLRSARRRGTIAVVIAAHGASVNIGQRLMLDETGLMEGELGLPELTAAVLDDARMALNSGESHVGHYTFADGWADVLIEYVEPPLQLVVFGAGADATPLTAFAKGLGWQVTIVDLRSGPAGARRLDADTLVRCSPLELSERLTIDPRAAVVVMTHNYAHDLAALRWLAGKPLRYLGLLGPRHRMHRLMSEMEDAALSRAEYFHAPIGLDIGARSPEEIALAIVGEITAALRARPGGMLRDRPGLSTTEVKPCPIAAS